MNVDEHTLSVAFTDLTASSRTSLSAKLSELVAAALTSNALTYRLQLSVIIKGSSGVGKMTMIRNVAQQLNLHVLEVCSSYCTHSAKIVENKYS